MPRVGSSQTHLHLSHSLLQPDHNSLPDSLSLSSMTAQALAELALPLALDCLAGTASLNTQVAEAEEHLQGTQQLARNEPDDGGTYKVFRSF